MSAVALLDWPAVATGDPAAIADLAAHCLWDEVRTWPKPGLVSHVDAGSHSDMDAGTFRRSADAIRPHLRRMAEGGAAGCRMADLRSVGLDAEQSMLAATAGVNTHRGAIFGVGLLCAAAGAQGLGLVRPDESLGDFVASQWGREIMGGAVSPRSNGQQAARRYGVGGARAEAARGFPTLYTVALPALREGWLLSNGNAEAARVHCCFALIASLDDTNLLHRGGVPGLLFAQHTAQRFLDDGGVGRHGWRQHAFAAHRAFVDRRLSPGGAADLLAMTLFVNRLQGPGVLS